MASESLELGCARTDQHTPHLIWVENPDIYRDSMLRFYTYQPVKPYIQPYIQEICYGDPLWGADG